MQIQTTSEDHRIAWLTALAISIHILESAFPSPLPGLKPGLANVITIAVLLQFGWRTAAWVSLLRVICGSLLLGTFLSPTFILSAGGTVCSVSILWLACRLPGEGFGAIGYSVLAALAHMTAIRARMAIVYSTFGNLAFISSHVNRRTIVWYCQRYNCPHNVQ